MTESLKLRRADLLDRVQGVSQIVVRLSAIVFAVQTPLVFGHMIAGDLMGVIAIVRLDAEPRALGRVAGQQDTVVGHRCFLGDDVCLLWSLRCRDAIDKRAQACAGESTPTLVHRKPGRAEERRVGKEGGSTYSDGWWRSQ